MKHKLISDNDIIKVCKCGETILAWQTVCSKCNKINVISPNK